MPSPPGMRLRVRLENLRAVWTKLFHVCTESLPICKRCAKEEAVVQRAKEHQEVAAFANATTCQRKAKVASFAKSYGVPRKKHFAEENVERPKSGGKPVTSALVLICDIFG